MSESLSNFQSTMELLRYTKQFRKKMILATLFSILNKLFDIAPPFLIAIAVDIAVRRESSIIGDFGITNLNNQLYVLGVVTFFVWACESFFQYTYQIYWRNLAQAVEHELRLDAYKHIQYLEMEFFEDRQTGGLMSILNDDVNQLERFLDTGANTFIQITTAITAILISFFLISPEVAWLAVVPMPFIIIFSFKFQGKLEPRYTEVRDKVGILNGLLSNNLSGISTIKSFTAEKYEELRIRESSNEYMNANHEAIKYSSAFTPLIRMIIVGGFILMMIFGGMRTLDGKLEIAAYSALIFLTQRILWPLTRLGETFDQYQRAMASTRRILGLLNTEIKIKSGNNPLSTSDVKGNFTLENINFKYKSREVLFKDFNVEIKSGETVAFVGSTGSGKTTLVKLLLRFYDPNDGKILLDGFDIKDISLHDYRKGIALVSQETFIIDGSVRENIAYGNLDTNLDEIIEAAKIAEVHDFIESLPQKYETLVGERGQKLSGGQRQRIAIARAVLKNPPILILDEATSSVDNETEAAIQRSLETIIVGRTTIIIAHRLSTIRNADRIFVIENGRIIEEGSHDELVANDMLYNTLWKVQTGIK